MVSVEKASQLVLDFGAELHIVSVAGGKDALSFDSEVLKSKIGFRALLP
ncbi:hypothetical protein LL912_02560 [Niabella sp. CC-SYL272]|nr:hypothetical protein [Niabella agricola]MCF3107653.1 hypothetical protein [Niabella agricola]